MSEHYLLASIGKSPRETDYELEQASARTHFSSTALVRMMKDKPSRVYLLLTETAKEGSFDVFRDENKLETEIIHIPDGVNDEEVEEILHNILNFIPQDCELTIDITQGLRHFPFLLFTSAMYLQSFKNISIRNIYYGMLEAEGERKPFIDLKVLLEMTDWFHAVRNFSEKRQGNALLEITQNAISNPTTEPETRIARELERLINQIGLFDIYYGTGLPLGLGDAAKSFCDQLSKKRDRVFPKDGPEFIPLGSELFDHAATSMNSYVLPNEIKTSGEWKKAYPLSMDEIKRQATIIEDYFQTAQYANAVRLMREWMISRCYLSHNVQGTGWLDRDARMPIERQLGSISWQSRHDILQDDKKDLAGLWDSMSQFRNVVAHTEMTTQTIDVKDNIMSVQECWEKMHSEIENDDFWNPFTGGGGGRLLITPLGFSRGLLYSALKLIKPEKCMIVTSKAVKGSISEILEKAEYPGEIIDPFVLNDPHTGFGEIKGILDSIVTDHAKTILDSDEIVVNLTGGTTTLQILAEEISKKAGRMGKDPRRVVIFDKRDEIVKRAEPYVVGEMKDYNEIISSNIEESDEDGEDRS